VIFGMRYFRRLEADAKICWRNEAIVLRSARHGNGRPGVWVMRVNGVVNHKRTWLGGGHPEPWW